MKTHSAKKKAKFEARRERPVGTPVHMVQAPMTYAEEKAANRAPAILAKEARQAHEKLLAATLPPGTRLPSLAPSGEFLRHCPYARRRHGRNRAHLRSVRGYQRAKMREAGNNAYRAQRTIERVFQDKAGMSWSDVARALKEKKWSWGQLHFLAAHKGIGPDLAVTVAIEKQKEAA